MSESDQLLAAARIVVERPGSLPGVAWPRTAALLARQALEAAVGAWLEREAPGLEGCSKAAQFVCLRWYVDDPDVARLAHQTWASLSQACHHHAYDLAPTAAELRAWLADVDRLVARLGPDSYGRAE